MTMRVMVIHKERVRRRPCIEALLQRRIDRRDRDVSQFRHEEGATPQERPKSPMRSTKDLVLGAQATGCKLYSLIGQHKDAWRTDRVTNRRQ